MPGPTPWQTDWKLLLKEHHYRYGCGLPRGRRAYRFTNKAQLAISSLQMGMASGYPSINVPLVAPLLLQPLQVRFAQDLNQGGMYTSRHALQAATDVNDRALLDQARTSSVDSSKRS